MAEILTYPFKTMRITQTYNGGTSHRPHTTGSPKDYPIDEGGKDGGRDAMYAPCDVKIVRIYGVGTGGTNSMWVQSTEKVTFANGKTDYMTMQITHPNDSDLRRLKVGQVVRKRNILCYEGTDGATGNHIHLSIGMGTMTGNGWTLNSNNKWVLTTSNGTVKPEAAFYVDPKFTKIDDSNGLKFKTLPTESKPAATKPKTETTPKAFLPARGYFKKGDVSANVGKIASFMRKNFPAYTSEKALGNTYGDNIIKAVKEFQRRTGLVADGNFGPLTLAELKKYGFEE